ncbi:hypothetical protein CVT26_012601 [Gymnopilus dilepis]|uniref:Histone H1 n=1 Tax=Gymnopilus dilepis TaxID=231916 RepID=A0A409WMX6_9AGAR|nr:hypothetical protein CVT26_012601 [Gymnopilus dilepis]
MCFGAVGMHRCEQRGCPYWSLTPSDQEVGGVSRSLLLLIAHYGDRFVESKYKLEIGAAQNTQLAKAITTGVEKGVFVLPKGLSGRVKLAPKSKQNDSAKENKPASKAKTTTAAAAKPKAGTVKKPAVKPSSSKAKASTSTTKKTTTAAKPKAASTATAKKPASSTKKVLAGKPKAAAKSTTTKKTTTAAKRAPAKKAATGTSSTTKAKAAAKKAPAKKAASTKKDASKPAAKSAAAKKQSTDVHNEFNALSRRIDMNIDMDNHIALTRGERERDWR